MNPEETPTETFYNDPSVVYPVEFLRDEFCTTFENMSVNDYTACSIQYQTTAEVAFYNIFIGIALGYIFARGFFRWT